MSALNVDFWVQQGVTFNADSPDNRSNYPVGFNDGSNEYQMNQAYLVLQKATRRCGCGWDVGGRLDLLYGTDWAFTAARGLETHGDFSPKWNGNQYGLAMPQAYLEAYAPWGPGVTMKLGHFYTILGYDLAAGTLDMVVLNSSNDSVEVELADGFGNFVTYQRPIRALGASSRMERADFDNGGCEDLVVQGDAGVAVYRSLGCN